MSGDGIIDRVSGIAIVGLSHLPLDHCFGLLVHHLLGLVTGDHPFLWSERCAPPC